MEPGSEALADGQPEPGASAPGLPSRLDGMIEIVLPNGVSVRVDTRVDSGAAADRLRAHQEPRTARAAAMELEAGGIRSGCGGLTLAPVNKVHHVRTIALVAEMLGEDEDWLGRC